MQKRHSTWPNMLKERMCKHLIAKHTRREFIFFWRKTDGRTGLHYSYEVAAPLKRSFYYGGISYYDDAASMDHSLCLTALRRKGERAPHTRLTATVPRRISRCMQTRLTPKWKTKTTLLKLHQMICHKVTFVLLRHYENWSIVEHYALSRKHLLQHFAP